MSDKKPLTTNLQESILTLICMDQEKGAIAANLVDVELFEPPYDDIAKRAIRYRRKFGKAPGEAHLDDLFDHILSDKKNKRQKLYQQVLGSIIELAPGLNAPYVLSRLNDFQKSQNLRAAILEAAERFERGGEDTEAEVENILRPALNFKPQDLDRGMYLNDTRGIEFLTLSTAPDFYLQIDEFDRRGIGLVRGEAMGFTAPKGRGKTWACVDVGVSCLQQRAKVFHCSLEMKDQRVIPRYLRRMFAIGRNREKYRSHRLVLDKLNRLEDIKPFMKRAKLAISDADIDRQVAKRMAKLDSRLKNLHFKSFPTSQLTLGQLVAYLDNLEASDGFVPDVFILDYPKLMRLDRKQELRIALGQRMEELRGLLAERNMAGFFPFQTNREGEDASLITGKQVGEDYSLTQTVDSMITYNQTKAEKELNVARLYYDKGRNEQDGFSVAISQDYETGQFVTRSAYMPNNYFDLVKQNGSDEEEEDDGEVRDAKGNKRKNKKTEDD